MEGWQAWDIILRCSGQLRMTQFAALGIDMNAALKIGDSLGYDRTGLAELLPSCELGLVSAINQKVNKG